VSPTQHEQQPAAQPAAKLAAQLAVQSAEHSAVWRLAPTGLGLGQALVPRTETSVATLASPEERVAEMILAAAAMVPSAAALSQALV